MMALQIFRLLVIVLQHVFKKVSMVFAIALIILGTTSAISAQDGAANYQVVGYSEDGRYFAIEEFGREAVTGVPFAQISVFDLRTGLFVLGTPASATSLDDELTPGDMLIEVRERTTTIFEDLNIELPATALAVHGDGERVENTRALEFGILLNDGSQRISGRYELELEQFDALSSSDCLLVQSGIRPQGYALYFENFGQRLEIHRDTILTRNRGCPISYQLKAVYVPFDAVDVQYGVALIMVNVQTDYGVERRFLPVSLGVSFGGPN